ncbi:MAG: hypothetical protein Kow0068_19410 [Marinilabiliales bacterium]
MTNSLLHKDLVNSNDFLKVILDNIHSVVFILDDDLRVQQFNQAFPALFKKPEEEIFGELCGNALGCSFMVEENNDCGKTSNCKNCELRKSLLKSFIDNIPTEGGILIRNFYLGEQKIRKYFRYTAKKIRYNDKNMILVIFDDITELEIKNQELIKLNEQKNKFLGIAAHDLRNPIGVIQSFSELLLDTINEDDIDKKKELLEYIYEGSKAAIDLLNELLDISKIESGLLELQIVKDNYVDFVTKNISINKIYAQKKNISLKLDIKSKIPEFPFDRTRIEQVLNNLISNAIKYSYPISSVTVRVSKKDNSVLTEVIDEGQGIPEKDFHKIFQEFGKTSVKATAGERSTGLGLAISKKIVESHNGKIGFKSTVGKGSVFFFELPIKD